MSEAFGEHGAPEMRPGTRVTFPAGSVSERVVVIDVLHGSDASEGVIVVTDVTPFHPLNPSWPDQPDDRGHLTVDNHSYDVSGTVTIVRLEDGTTLVGDAVRALSRSSRGVDWLVGHVVMSRNSSIRPGMVVDLLVDKQRRQSLSAAHTACHLVAFALNEVLEPLWRKEYESDSRGKPDFDRLACISSQHSEDGSIDVYRLGKSTRRRGVDVEAIHARLPEILGQVQTLVREWVSSDAPVRIEAEGPHLADLRTWWCALPGRPAQMSCGGTHVRRLGELRRVDIDGSLDGDEWTIKTATAT